MPFNGTGKQTVFPVYAGVILIKIENGVLDTSVPRVCGGDPLFATGFTLVVWCSRVCGGVMKLS